MHYGGPRGGHSIDVVSHGPHVLDEGLGGLGHAVVRPDRVVEVAHHPRVCQLAFLRCPEKCPPSEPKHTHHITSSPLLNRTVP